MKLHDQKGFGALEAVLILLALAIISFGGWYALHIKQNKTAMDNKKNSSSQANWRSYTTKTARVNFKYPASWKLSDVSLSSDMVVLKSADGFQASISFSDMGHPSLDYEPVIRLAKDITFMGDKGYLVFVGGTPAESSDGLVHGTFLSRSADKSLDTFEYSGKFAVSISSVLPRPETVDAAKTDANLADMVSVINSMKPG
jgi:hypothetical protein